MRLLPPSSGSEQSFMSWNTLISNYIIPLSLMQLHLLVILCALDVKRRPKLCGINAER